ncbi:MAG: hypothetical protein ACRDOY_12225 [Nocardioidaceae bacterium]
MSSTDDTESDHAANDPPLVVAPCEARCAWGPTGRRRFDGLELFRCSGCGAEWVRSEPWTPIDSGGLVPESVAAEAARRDSR